MLKPCPENVAQLDDVISAPNEQVVETVRRHDGDFAVLGAGGKMGYHLCLMLRRALDALERPSRVLAVSRFRSLRSQAEFKAAGCKAIAADLSTPDGVAAVPDVPNVFFLAGVKFGTAHDRQLLERMNVRMPALVAERFRNSRIVALSMGCVYSFTSPASGGSTEDDATDPPGAYAKSCQGRERAFFDAAERWGARSALVRLNYAIDLRYGVLLDIAQKVRAGRPVDVTTGYVNVIWQGDALAHTVQCLSHAAAPPLVVNVTGARVLRVRDLAHAFAERFGCEVTFAGEEAPTAWLSNATRAHRRFGPPTVSVEQMIDWIAAWLKRGGPTLDKPTHFENRDGNY